MSKHTKGKWSTHVNPTTKGKEVWSAVGMTGMKICTCFEGDHFENDDMPQIDTEANAKLIAAAPELLAALKVFVNNENQWAGSARALIQANEAIKKATS